VRAVKLARAQIKQAYAKRQRAPKRQFKTTPSAASASAPPNQTVTTAPLAVGTVGQYSQYPTQTGKPQMDTDVTNAADWSTAIGVRIAGQDIISGYVGMSPVNGHTGLCYSLGGSPTSSWMMNLSPLAISPRLAQLEQTYFFYAFRELTFQYIPIVNSQYIPTGGTTNLGSCAITMAVCGNNDSASSMSDTTISFQQAVSEIVPSVTGLAWETMALTYKFNGKRVFETSTNNVTEADEMYQGALLIGSNVFSFNDTPYQIGIMRVSYVIDFYQPSFVQTSPTLSLVMAMQNMHSAILSLDKDSKDGKALTRFKHRFRHGKHDDRLETFIRDNYLTIAALARGFHSTRIPQCDDELWAGYPEPISSIQPSALETTSSSSSSSSSSSQSSTSSSFLPAGIKLPPTKPQAPHK